jgi:hypothetical protein
MKPGALSAYIHESDRTTDHGCQINALVLCKTNVCEKKGRAGGFDSSHQDALIHTKKRKRMKKARPNAAKR